MYRLLLAISLILPLFLLPACVNETPDGADPVTVGMRVPRFEVTTLDGDVFSTRGDLTGEMMIIFFNTECPDCERELPLVQQYYDRTLTIPADRRTRLICISREENARSVSDYWHQHDFTMPVAACDDRAVYSLFAISGIPRVYTIRDGIICSVSSSLP